MLSFSASVSSICFKLNSVQLKTLLRKYEPGPQEAPISAEMIETIVRVAENTVDEMTNSEGKEVGQLKHWKHLQITRISTDYYVVVVWISFVDPKFSIFRSDSKRISSSSFPSYCPRTDTAAISSEAYQV